MSFFDKLKNFFKKKNKQVEHINEEIVATVENTSKLLEEVAVTKDNVETNITTVETLLNSFKSFQEDYPEFLSAYTDIFITAFKLRFENTEKPVDLKDKNIRYKLNACFKYVVRDARDLFNNTYMCEDAVRSDYTQISIFTDRLLLNKRFELDFKEYFYKCINEI